MSDPLCLIVGLGNPGSQYEQTRHNAGFWFVDELARHFGATFRTENRFSGLMARVLINRQEVWLLKPTTFMNRSGQSVSQVMAFYKIPLSAVLVAHDEIDLSVGDVRFKFGGGHGGHNGLRDIFAHAGRDFWRVRIGVSHPGHRDQVVDYVLGRPNRNDKKLIDQALSAAIEALPELIAGSGERAMHALHSR
jgi:peptidyl-tRNA hydrolase, PTH1 family